MTRGKTASTMALAARRRRAKELFTRGFGPHEVAQETGVTLDTARRYHRQFADEIRDQANANPHLLRDLLPNTVRALSEIDQVRQEAWRNYQTSRSDSAKSTFLSLALKAGAERHKVLQLFGVKAEYMGQVALLQRQQEALIKFLSEHEFCDRDREQIIDFIASQLDVDNMVSLPSAEEPDYSVSH